MVWLSLFASAFLAATLFPAQSELVLGLLLLKGEHPVWALLAVATAGNVLGALLNWGMGRCLLQFRERRWFPASPAALERASGWYRRWGRWSLLGSFLPVVGDPLTLAAGVLREPLRSFLPLVLIAKGGRYLALAWALL